MIEPALAARVEAALGRRPLSAHVLGGGCIADIRRLDFAAGAPVVAKWGGGLAIEAYMLRYLADHSALPVPAVLHGDDDLLLIEHIEAGDTLDGAAEAHAADLLAALHGVTAQHFGHERDTVIAGLPQANPWTESWVAFFRDHRLLPMGRLALAAGRLPAPVFARLERFAARLETWIGEPSSPSLIHGDMWGGNVLVRGGRVAAFVDPAIYHADAEIELAFSTLFSTFGRAFFDRYRERRPLAPGFFEERRDIYNLYPLLVHARLFGGGYPAAADRILKRFVG